jgi:hypothetical protein
LPPLWFPPTRGFGTRPHALWVLFGGGRCKPGRESSHYGSAIPGGVRSARKARADTAGLDFRLRWRLQPRLRTDLRPAGYGGPMIEITPIDGSYLTSAYFFCTTAIFAACIFYWSIRRR